MRDTLNPSCLEIENPPSRLRDGSPVGGGGIGADAMGEAGRRAGASARAGGGSTRASASTAVAEGANAGRIPIQLSVRCRIESSFGIGVAGSRGAGSVSAAVSDGGFKQSMTNRYGL